MTHLEPSGRSGEWEQKWVEQNAYNDHLISENNKLRASRNEIEAARSEQWRLRRDAEGSRDAARAAADSMRIERDILRLALSEISGPRDCGCSPSCQCDSAESLKIELDHLRDIAAAALSKATA